MKNIFLLLCISFCIGLQAQQVSLSFLPSGDIENEEVSIHKYGNKFCTDKTNWGRMQFAFSANLKKVKLGVELFLYDEQFKELKKLSIDDGKNDLGPFRPIVHYGKNAIYVLYFRFTDDDKIKIIVSKINPDDLSVTATQEVMEYDQKNRALWGTVKTIDDTYTSFNVSEDEKNVWIIHTSSKMILSTVIDSDLKIVQNMQSTPIEIKDFKVISAHIGNDGNKVLAYEYSDPDVKDFHATALFFQPVNQNGPFQNIKLTEGNIAGHVKLKLSRDGRKLYLGGEYHGEEYADAGKGVLLSEINMKTQSLSTPVLYPYTSELRQRALDLDFAVKRKGENVFRDHELNYTMNEMDNGTIVFSSDMTIVTGTVNTGTGSSGTSYIGPIIHVFARPGGDATMTLIAKKQIASSFTKFSTYVFKNKLICLYVDAPKFLEKEFEDKKRGIGSRLGELIPVVNIYDADGKLTERQILLENRKSIKGNIELRFGSKINDNKFVFLVTEDKFTMSKRYTAVNQVCYMEFQ